jgi:predicted RNA-binding protein with PUA-like domain
MRYWLMKSEPSVYGIADLARDKHTAWTGVRNYQARNFMRDDMRPGDPVLFYHSSCDEPGIAGIAKVSRAAYPDATQFERKSRYYDAASRRDEPRWFNVDIAFVKKTPLISLAELRRHPALANMQVLRRGNRLSITPVEPSEWKFLMKLIDADRS